MNQYLLHCAVILSLVLFSCESSKNQGSDFSRKFPLPVPMEISAVTHWAKKEVKDSLLVDDMEGKINWVMRENPIAILSYTEDRAIEGKKSLRYQTHLRDTANLLKPENRTAWGSFEGQQGGGSGFGITFDEPRDWTDFNRVSIWVYIHPSKNPIYHFFLEIINEGTDYNTITPRKDNVVQDLDAGCWHKVIWEIPHLDRNKVKRFNIFHTSIGYNPEGEDVITYDFDRLQVEKADADHYEGWSIPENQFAFSHVGYRPRDQKIALANGAGGKEFRLVDQKDKVVYTSDARLIENENGSFRQLDFSEFQKEGTYRLQYGKSLSKPFPISKDIWLETLFSSINFYFCQRCGFDVPGIHGVCHLDFQGFHGDEVKVINGGWHDAGDLSQGYFRTAIGSYVLLRNLELIQQNNALGALAEKLQDEAAWGLKWLQKTRFNDGYHISWARLRMYTDNVIGTIDDVMIQARNAPWKNFLEVAVKCKASRLLRDSHPELAEEARKAAIEDWQYAVAAREQDQATPHEASWGAISSILLFNMTGDTKYKEHAIRFGDLLMQCQEQVLRDGIPITGYFYTSTSRQRIVQNNHGAYEEAPMLVLKELCNAFSDHKNWINWYQRCIKYNFYNDGIIRNVVASGQPSINHTIDKKNMFWPIPEVAITSNNQGKLFQNYGYSGYDASIPVWDNWEDAVADEAVIK